MEAGGNDDIGAEPAHSASATGFTTTSSLCPIDVSTDDVALDVAGRFNWPRRSSNCPDV
jgi:hypothetical protein